MRALRDSREMRLGIKNLPTAPTLTRLVSPVHFGKPGRHFPHDLYRPFLAILMALEDCLGDIKCL